MINKRKGQLAFALGYGGMYNHANPANLTYSALRSTNVLMFFASQTIQAGAELTINYDVRLGFNPSSESSWAKLNDVQLI